MHTELKRETTGKENKAERVEVNSTCSEDGTFSTLLISFFDEEINTLKFFSSCLDISTVVLLSSACFVVCASLFSWLWRLLFHSSDDYSFLSLHLASVPGYNASTFADGVGGWRSYGVDPSKFPLSLMSTCERMVRENRFQPHAPASIIADSYYELLEQKQPLVGSSTACIVSLHREERTVYTANLGDSGFLVIRHDEVIHRSQEQQHYFNTPFQLAVAPPPQRGQIISDSPSMAENSSFGVQEGDIILLGTDGLFDNMNEDMLLDYVSKLKDHRQDNIQKTASKIAEEAHQLAFDPDYLSPFALTAIDAGIEIRGGKPDDITVVLARVSSLTESEKEALHV